jgi:hypothetical protein
MLFSIWRKYKAARISIEAMITEIFTQNCGTTSDYCGKGCQSGPCGQGGVSLFQFDH